ncbi:hypothetical protein MFIFM68171_03141 [Madurella fahalii]|uniref:Uncharacterized protein n=1 Tax=Madurella fahalii TaxID=1157608 RepID=A0ABQ0G596_9PEZI
MDDKVYFRAPTHEKNWDNTMVETKPTSTRGSVSIRNEHAYTTGYGDGNGAAGVDSEVHRDAYFHAPSGRDDTGCFYGSPKTPDRNISQCSFQSDRTVIFAPQDARTYNESQMACTHPDCIQEAEYAQFFGEQKKWRLTTTMMKAYVAMRNGTNSLPIGPRAPILPHLLNQEWNKARGDPYLLHEIQEGMRSDMPDNPNRGEFYYYDRPADEGHLIPSLDYYADGIAAKDVFRSEGWDAANKKVTRSFNEWYPREPSSLLIHGTTENKGKAPEWPRPHMYTRFLLPPVQASSLPTQCQQSLDDGWISDDEGHPEESRITPCTFAFLATGCRLADEHKDMKPVIPKDQPSARPPSTPDWQAGEKATMRQQRRDKRAWRLAHPEPYYDEEDGELLWSPSAGSQDTSIDWSPRGT